MEPKSDALHTDTAHPNSPFTAFSVIAQGMNRVPRIRSQKQSRTIQSQTVREASKAGVTMRATLPGTLKYSTPQQAIIEMS